jgi:hypothetical protein
MTVVGHQTRRRWAAVAAGAAVLCALPVIVAFWPVRAAAVGTGTLRTRILASAGQAYQGYALSSGAMGLPALPRLAGVAALFSGATRMRAWYAGPRRWRVDVLGTGTERDLYQRPEGQYVWDYADNALTLVTGEQPVRLPRAADLLPPDLARRLLAAATGDRVAALPARRVAGRPAAGLRVIPTDPHTTVARVDIWADPGSGLPLAVDVTGRGATRPILSTRFLQVSLAAPADATLRPPAVPAGAGFTESTAADVLGVLRRSGADPLPPVLAGQPRLAAAAALAAAGRYGRGLAQFVVLRLPGAFGRQAEGGVETYGQRVPLDRGEASMISTGLLGVLVLRTATDRDVYLVAGLVDATWLREVGQALAAAQP